MLVAVAGTVAGDRALRRIAEVNPADRAFTVAMSPDLSPTATDIGVLNDKIDRRLQQRGFGPTIAPSSTEPSQRVTVARFASQGSTMFNGSRLIDGAWPAKCDAQRCEVIAFVPASADPQPVAPLRRIRSSD
jgi:hypothetical protein